MPTVRSGDHPSSRVARRLAGRLCLLSDQSLITIQLKAPEGVLADAIQGGLLHLKVKPGSLEQTVITVGKRQFNLASRTTEHV